jgi:hypothetical protein
MGAKAMVKKEKRNVDKWKRRGEGDLWRCARDCKHKPNNSMLVTIEYHGVVWTSWNNLKKVDNIHIVRSCDNVVCDILLVLGWC